jgi:hypothetical protein
MHIPIPSDKDAHVCEHIQSHHHETVCTVSTMLHDARYPRAQDGIGCRKAHLDGLQLRWFHMNMSAAFDTGGEEGSSGGGARVGVWYASGYGGMGRVT